MAQRMLVAALATGATMLTRRIADDVVTVTVPPGAREKLEAARRAAIAARDEEFRREAAAKKSAAINRHTGKPHEHRRAKARRLRRISTDPSWPPRSAA